MKLWIKRATDLIMSLILLTLLSPLMIGIAILVRAKLGNPILFKQNRPGKEGEIFTMYKFRTMNNDEDKYGQILPDRGRLSKFGHRLRNSSLDELPELFNILKGEMSFVGPRPLLIQYLDRYSPEQARRHEVKPGLTGWAQVNGRNSISWEEKFKLDVWYVDNLSLLLDIKILFMTFSKVLNQHGVAAEGEVTMNEFMGNKED